MFVLNRMNNSVQPIFKVAPQNLFFFLLFVQSTNVLLSGTKWLRSHVWITSRCKNLNWDLSFALILRCSTPVQLYDELNKITIFDVSRDQMRGKCVSLLHWAPHCCHLWLINSPIARCMYQNSFAINLIQSYRLIYLSSDSQINNGELHLMIFLSRFLSYHFSQFHGTTQSFKRD